MIVAEPRTQTLNGTTQAGPDLRRAVRGYVRAYASLHGRRKAAEDLGVSRHTLWRFLERGHTGRSVPSAVLNSVGEERCGRLRRPHLRSSSTWRAYGRTLRFVHLRQSLEEALLLLCATPPATVEELSRFGRIPSLHAPRPAEEADRAGPRELRAAPSERVGYSPAAPVLPDGEGRHRSGRSHQGPRTIFCGPTRCPNSGSGCWPSGWTPWPCSTAWPP